MSRGMRAGGRAGVGRGGGRFGARGSEFGRYRGYGGPNALGYPGYGVGYLDPFWYDYDEPDFNYEPPPPLEPPAPPMLMPPPPAPPEPQRIPSNPKMMEVPGAKAEAAAKPLPPAVFILSNGERIESRQYLITSERVQLTVDRHERSIPLDQLDLKATTAADRERGIDLRIPVNSSEVSLGF
jgi:hypothetical protein